VLLTKSFLTSVVTNGRKYPYLVEALTSTKPDIASASSIVSADAFKASNSDPDTLSSHEAMWDKLSLDQWPDVAWNEILLLEAHGTWELDEISNATSKVLPGTWVFRVKRSPDGTIIKYKARYCVCGDLQEGERETFAPVVAWDTSVINFSSTFVRAILKEPTWIHLSQGFQSSTGFG
jgi:hypothetical protein